METLRSGVINTSSGLLPHGDDNERHAPAASLEGEESFSTPTTRRETKREKGFFVKRFGKKKIVKYFQRLLNGSFSPKRPCVEGYVYIRF
jgi:hypothetical protein